VIDVNQRSRSVGRPQRQTATALFFCRASREGIINETKRSSSVGPVCSLDTDVVEKIHTRVLPEMNTFERFPKTPSPPMPGESSYKLFVYESPRSPFSHAQQFTRYSVPVFDETHCTSRISSSSRVLFPRHRRIRLRFETLHILLCRTYVVC